MLPRHDRFNACTDPNGNQQYFYKNGKIISKGGPPIPLGAYWFFAIRAEAFIAVDEGDARTRLLALADAIFQHFQFIVITLSKEDDPQVIFATLNTGGEPLAAMDLVRNDVFLRASRNHEDEESSWTPTGASSRILFGSRSIYPGEFGSG